MDYRGVLGLTLGNSSYLTAQSPRTHPPNRSQQAHEASARRARYPGSRAARGARNAPRPRALDCSALPTNSRSSPVAAAEAVGSWWPRAEPAPMARLRRRAHEPRGFPRYHILAILFGDFSREGRTTWPSSSSGSGPADLTGARADGSADVRSSYREGRPIMAMTRLPRAQSAGKANLHQGAVGVGIDMASGETATRSRTRGLHRAPRHRPR